MTRKINKTGRTSKEPVHVRMYKWLTDMPAWQALNAVERAVYWEVKSYYNGSNNGTLFYSVRKAEQALKIGKSTAAAAFHVLEFAGFIRPNVKGAFSIKQRHATQWRLTELPCDATGEIATHEFKQVAATDVKRCRKVLKKQNTVRLQVQPVPNEVQNCTQSGTAPEGKPPICTLLRTDKPISGANLYLEADTDNIPGDSPSGAASSQPEVGGRRALSKSAVASPPSLQPNRISSKHLLETDAMKRVARLERASAIGRGQQ